MREWQVFLIGGRREINDWNTLHTHVSADLQGFFFLFFWHAPLGVGMRSAIVVTFELFELYYWLELYELYYKRNKVHKVKKSKS